MHTLLQATVPALDSWDRKAMVRLPGPAPSRPLPAWRDDHDLFNPALAPYTDHPSVIKLGRKARQWLGACRLADYLTRTEAVELEIVNPALMVMRGLASTDERVLGDLLKIYTDEGYHALVMVEFRQTLARLSGIDLVRRPPASVAAILGRIDRLPARQHGLGLLCAAIVTETLVTSTLRQAGARDTVHPAVRDMLASHAADECRHQAFFTRFAGRYLSSLAPADRDVADDLLPPMMWDFLAPDWHYIADDLATLGLEPSAARDVLHESYDATALRDQFMAASVATRRLLARVCPRAVDRFESQVQACCDGGVPDILQR